MALKIVPYDKDWPVRFERERAALYTVFSPASAAVEHVGSTAVPGLGAKPVIDILVGVSTLSDVECRIQDLRVMGYDYVPEYEAQLPERRYFRKLRTHHLHCVVLDSPFWEDHLAFRDYLRAHQEAAAAYYQLKLDLASQHRHDRAAYTDAKSGYIESILEKAASRAYRSP